MNLIEALKLLRPLRRPLIKFMGSNGDGWMDSTQIKTELLCGPWISGLHRSVTRRPDHALTEDDLLADDWEVKPLTKYFADSVRK